MTGVFLTQCEVLKIPYGKLAKVNGLLGWIGTGQATILTSCSVLGCNACHSAHSLSGSTAHILPYQSP